MAHIVRKAYSKRCAKNIHGHSYTLEVMLDTEPNYTFLDEAGMVIDFWKVKELISDFIDSFDHSLMLWDIPEEKELIDFAVKNFDRVIIAPFNSTAEQMARMFYEVIERLMPEWVDMLSCRVHETSTGYAEYFGTDDTGRIVDQDIVWFRKEAQMGGSKHLCFSDWIAEERKDKERPKKYAKNFTM